MSSFTQIPTLYTFEPTSALAQSAEHVADALTTALSDGPLVLLISGGSVTHLAGRVAQRLVQSHARLDHLTLTLFDERFVPHGSPDSNEMALHAQNVITPLTENGATWRPFLDDTSDASGSVLAERASAWLQKHITDKTPLWIIAGLGEDAHTAGLLPTEDATLIASLYETSKLVAYYELPPASVNPHRARITSTPALIRQSDRIFLYCVGDQKKPALIRLLSSDEPTNTCPARALLTSTRPIDILTDIMIHEL